MGSETCGEAHRKERVAREENDGGVYGGGGAAGGSGNGAAGVGESV